MGTWSKRRKFKLIVGVGEPLLGRIAVLDALSGTWRHVPVQPSPATPAPTQLFTPTEDEGASCEMPLPTITPRDLAERLAARARGQDDLDLIDVREPDEHTLVAIPGSRLIPQDRFADDETFDELPRDRDVVLYCRSGVRSADVLSRARSQGLSRVSHLAGGILAWADEVDPSLPRY